VEVFEMMPGMKWKMGRITKRSKGLLMKEWQEFEMGKLGTPGYLKTGEPEENAWTALTSLKASASHGEKKAFLIGRKHEKTNRQYFAWLVGSRYQQVQRGVI